jgi:hypothetical protein
MGLSHGFYPFSRHQPGLKHPVRLCTRSLACNSDSISRITRRKAAVGFAGLLAKSDGDLLRQLLARNSIETQAARSYTWRVSYGVLLPRPLRVVSGLAEDTNSINCEGHEPDAANGCLVLLGMPGPSAVRQSCADRDPDQSQRALSRARPKASSFCLYRPLIWMSPPRNLARSCPNSVKFLQLVSQCPDSEILIPGVDGERCSAGIQLAADVAAAAGVVAVHRQRQLAIDVAVACVQVDVSGQSLRQAYLYVSIRSLYPRRSCQLRTLRKSQIEAATAGMNLDSTQFSIDRDVSIGRSRFQRSR